MKNFKLLLATTAILSATTMAANADIVNTNSATVDISIGFVTPSYITKKIDMDFGKYAMPFTTGGVLPAVITLGHDGSVTNTNIDYYGGAKAAQVEWSGNMTNQKLSYPSKVELFSSTDNTKKCGEVKEFEDDGIKSTADFHYLSNIGAKFYLNTEESALPSTGSCGNSMTVTVVVDEGE